MTSVLYIAVVLSIIVGILAAIAESDTTSYKKPVSNKREKLDDVDHFVLWGEVNNDKFFDIM